VSAGGGGAVASDNQVRLVAVYGQPVDFGLLVTNNKMYSRAVHMRYVMVEAKLQQLSQQWVLQ
jgi:hypothetical protein